MKARLAESKQRSKTSIAISVAVHLGLLAILATVTYHYPIFFGPRPAPPVATPVRYVRLPARAGGAAGGSGTTMQTPDERRATAAARAVLAPTSIPVTIPQPAPSATGLGAGEAPNGPPRLGKGVEFGIPDTRIAMDPMAVGHLPRTDAQRADSAISAIYDQYLDSARAQMDRHTRDPGDWSWGGKDGDKWGWDPNGIHIGGITIPNAVLAALPLNMGPSGHNMNAITEARTESYIRSDIAMHANVMSEDEFREQVRRIRERKDRERAEQKAREHKPPV